MRLSAAQVEAMREADEARIVELQRELLEKLGRRAQNPRYLHEPVKWCHDVLGLDLWSRQEEICEATDENQIVMVPSGQKTGKSTVAMVIALWWVCTRKRAMVIATSGNNQQVRSILWRELTRLVNGVQLDKALGATLHVAPSSGFVFPDGRQILGFTAEDKEKMAGYSGDNLLFVVDESSGILDEIWEAIRGNLIGGGHALCLSNPTKTTGWFFERCTAMKDRQPVIRIDSRENPNYTSGEKQIPGLATREAVKELEEESGGDGNIVFDVRVKGLFPKQGSNAVISAAAVEVAIERHASAKVDWTKPIVIGVDVARFGDDDSVIQPVVGFYAFEPITFHGLDTKAMAGESRKVALQLAAMRDQARMAGEPVSDEKPHINVDVNGVGAGVVDNIDPAGVQVHGISGSERAIRDDKFVNRRSEIWFSIDEWLKLGGTMPKCARRDVELLAPVYRFGSLNRQQVESKDDIKAKIKRSPDHADALGLAVTRVPDLSGPAYVPAGRVPLARGGLF